MKLTKTVWQPDRKSGTAILRKSPGKIRRNAAAQKIRSNRSPIFLIVLTEDL
nr:MAG TPA: hypothetical protein [Caudoviricetes sp.]